MKYDVAMSIHNMLSELNENLRALAKQNKMLIDERCEFENRVNQYYEELLKIQEEKAELARENEHLKMLFDKEADTQIIKYKGQLYRVSSITSYIEAGEAETLDLTAVQVSVVQTHG